MPCLRGTEPTNKAQLTPSIAVFNSDVQTIRFNRGNAQSSNSIATPSNAGNAGSSSNKFNSTSVSGPNICPEAIRNNNA